MKNIVIKRLISTFIVSSMVFLSSGFITEAKNEVIENEDEEILLIDDIGDSLFDNWTLNSGTAVSDRWGRATFQKNNENTPTIVSNVDLVYDNCEIEYTFNVFSGEEIGILFRMESTDKNYLLKYDNSKKSFILQKKLGGKIYTDLKTAKYNLKNKPTTVHLTLINELIEVSIDGKTIISVNDDGLTSGRLGLYGFNVNGYIDDIKVYKDTNKDYSVPKQEEVAKKESKVIYVAAEGNDKNSGSYESPIKTVQEAKKRVSELKKGENPVDVVFKEGTYPISDTITFKQSDSGTKSAPITYKAEDGKEVIFDASIKLNASAFKVETDKNILSRMYKNVRGKVVSAHIDDLGLPKDLADFTSFYQTCGIWDRGQSLKPPTFFLNGKSQSVARYPNAGYLTIEKCESGGARDGGNGVDTGGKIFFSGTFPKRWLTATNAFVEGFLPNWWHGEWVQIDKVDMEIRSVNLKHWTRYGINSGNRWSVVNLLEEIDIPSEWYIDRDTMIMYYYPPNPLTEDDVFEVTGMEKDFISISQAEYINIEGIKFTKNTAQSDAYSSSLGGGYGIYAGDSRNITVKNCVFEHIGLAGISLSKSTNCVVDSCVFADIGFHGVYSSGGNIQKTVASNNTVRNCNFINASRDNKDSSAVPVRLDGLGDTVEHNVIHNTWNGAIWYTGPDNIMQYNEIYNSCNRAADAGAIYAGRTLTAYGNKVKYNYFHDMGVREGLNEYPASSIFWDDLYSGTEFTQNISVVNNMHKASSVKIGGGADNVVSGNTMVASAIDIIGEDRSSSNSNAGTTMKSMVSFDYLSSPYVDKYPQTAKVFSNIGKNGGYFYPSNTITNNLSVDCGTTNISSVMKNHSIVENNVFLKKDQHDGDIFVDTEKQDYRVTNEAREKYNIPNSILGEEFNIDLIGMQVEYKRPDDAFDFNLEYPADKQTNISLVEPQISWTKLDYADEYEYVVATDPELKNVVAQGSTIYSSATIEGLENSKTYYWTVYAKDTSRQNGVVKQALNGVYSFETAMYDDLDMTLLNEAITLAEEKLSEITEGTNIGDYKEGTKATFENSIKEAKEVSKITKGTQTKVNEAESKLRLDIQNLQGYLISGYEPLSIKSDVEWVSNANKGEVMKVKDGEFTISTPKDVSANVTMQKKLSNSSVQNFDIKAEFSDDSWFGINIKQQANVTMWGDKCYYIVVKKDLVELQGLGTILETKPNTYIKSGEWHNIEFGAVPTVKGINIYFAVDGEVVFDRLEQTKVQTEEGMFGLYVQSEQNITVRTPETPAEGMFELSEKIQNEIAGKDIKIYTGDEFTLEGNWQILDNDGYENQKYAVSSKKGDKAYYVMLGDNACEYKVYYYHKPSDENDNNVEIFLTGYADEYKTNVDMTKGEEGFVELGTFTFQDADYQGRLTINFTGSGNGKVPVTAVKIEKVIK